MVHGDLSRIFQMMGLPRCPGWEAIVTVAERSSEIVGLEVSLDKDIQSYAHRASEENRYSNTSPPDF